MKFYIKAIAYIFFYLIIFILLLTLLHYFNIINESLLEIGKLIAVFISLFIGGFKVGKRETKKGWLAGIKLSLIIIIIFLLLSLSFSFKISLRTLVYYLIIITSSMMGSIIGINKKKKDSIH